MLSKQTRSTLLRGAAILGVAVSLSACQAVGGAALGGAGQVLDGLFKAANQGGATGGVNGISDVPSHSARTLDFRANAMDGYVHGMWNWFPKEQHAAMMSTLVNGLNGAQPGSVIRYGNPDRNGYLVRVLGVHGGGSGFGGLGGLFGGGDGKSVASGKRVNYDGCYVLAHHTSLQDGYGRAKTGYAYACPGDTGRWAVYEGAWTRANENRFRDFVLTGR